MRDAAQPVLREILDEGVALPFSTVVLRLRQRGVALTEVILERRLRSADSGVRVLDPWRGPQAALSPLIAAEAGTGASGLWVIPMQDASVPSGQSGTYPLRRSLRCLGHALDERSPRDVARWISLVQEARQLQRRAA